MNNRLLNQLNVPQTASTTATTGMQNNFTLADLLAAKEILKSFPMPKHIKSITFNNFGLIKFRHAAKIDPQLLKR